MAGAQLNGSIPGKKTQPTKKQAPDVSGAGFLFQDVFWLLGEFFACRIGGVPFMFIYICICKYIYIKLYSY